MTNTYATTVERYGRLETEFDMRRFAGDLAAALGGTRLDPKTDDRFDRDRDTIEVDGIRLWLTVKTWGAGAGAKVHVHAMRPRDNLTYSDHPYGADYKLPTAYVSSTRPMAAIAKDVRRRVIEPAKPVLEKWLEHGRAVYKRGEDLVARAERLRALGLEVRLDSGATRTGNFHGFGLYGEFYADGAVNMRHINLKAAAFEAVVAALATGKENA